jgi:para-nitrobenzyl esterase
MRHRLSIVVAVALAAIGLGGCRFLDPEFDYAVVTDVVYGDALNEHGVQEQLKLDLYAPVDDTATDRPVVIWAHGGSFLNGDKSESAEWVIEFARRGYVAASINYRMEDGAPPVSYPFDAREFERVVWALSDMKTAVRWFRANASALGIDPGRIAVGGRSAGAVMAVTTAATPDLAGDSSDHTAYSSAVCTAVSVAGATEPGFVTPEDAGAVFFHGDQDTTVPYDLAVRTSAAMDAQGLATEFHVYEGQGHGIVQRQRADILDKTYRWLFARLVHVADPCV